MALFIMTAVFQFHKCDRVGDKLTLVQHQFEEFEEDEYQVSKEKNKEEIFWRGKILLENDVAKKYNRTAYSIKNFVLWRRLNDWRVYFTMKGY